MLKFPLSRLSEKTRKIAFSLIMIAVVALFLWFMQTTARQMQLMHFTLWYDIVVNGVLAGGSILLMGLMTTEKWLRMKAVGGGAGVVSCCIVANGAMLAGAMLTSSVFAFLAPLLIMGTLSVAKRKQTQSSANIPTASATTA